MHSVSYIFNFDFQFLIKIIISSYVYCVQAAVIFCIGLDNCFSTWQRK